MRAFLFATLLVALTRGQDAAAPAAASVKKAPGAKGDHHAGPFSAFTKSLPQEKKKPFMELMKRLRGAKSATGACINLPRSNRVDHLGICTRARAPWPRTHHSLPIPLSCSWHQG